MMDINNKNVERNTSKNHKILKDMEEKTEYKIKDSNHIEYKNNMESLVRVREILDNIRKSSPLIHCITNPISINDCANAILALGARPIMAEHPEEVEEIVDISDSLSLNIGNITDARKESILKSSKRAFEKNIPVVIDIVGVGCSRFRRNIVDKILNEYKKFLREYSYPMVVKGNISEIKTFISMYENRDIHTISGVDSDERDQITLENMEETVEKIKKISKQLNLIIVATGKIDVVTYGEDVYFVENGTPVLGKITGSGCMLTSIISSIISKNEIFEGCILSVALMGICGQLAERYSRGTATFKINLIDEISNCTEEKILDNIRIKNINLIRKGLN